MLGAWGGLGELRNSRVDMLEPLLTTNEKKVRFLNLGPLLRGLMISPHF